MRSTYRTKDKKRSGKQKNRHTRRRSFRRGGNVRNAVDEIVSEFGLVKRTYGEIVRKFLDEDVEDLRGFMEENENKGTLAPNAFFFGKAKGGEYVVIVSKYADEGFLSRLRALPGDTQVYVTDTDIEYFMGDGWDHAADTGYVSTRSFALSGEFDDDGIEYEVYFHVDSSYSETEDPRATKQGSWDKGAGELRVSSHTYAKAPAKTRKLAVASMASLGRMGLDTDLADEVAKKLHLQDKVPKERIDLRITESNIYTPVGELAESFRMDSETEERLSDAREEHERMLPLMDARLREEEEQRRQWVEDMSRPYYDDPYDDYGNGYGYDDDRYGGRRSTRTKRSRRSKGKRSTRRRSI